MLNIFKKLEHYILYLRQIVKNYWNKRKMGEKGMNVMHVRLQLARDLALRAFL